MTAAPQRTILCMKWGKLYPADYVNVLFNACKRHLAGSFRFVCLTDDALGFVDGIEALPIPDISLTPDQWYLPGIWPKLAIYLPNLHGLTGRCLFIDLDMMVLGDLEPMFVHGTGFVATDMGPGWENPPRAGEGKVATSIFAFDFGAETQILDAFLADPAGSLLRFQNEQDFVGAYAKSMNFFPPGWVLSFKRHLRQPIGLDLFRSPKRPPRSARVLAFHGKPRPADLLRNSSSFFWDRLPHMGHGKVPWMA
ncbi:hypothetical protein, partial [Pseudorhodobacter sp.]|uniref:hypothetical protein n=1 Tax=Pseudorhodobacter sp. TaxID=1934400 RepID=UPI00264895D8